MARNAYRHADHPPPARNMPGPSSLALPHSDIYIPSSYEERQRRGIESHLSRVNPPLASTSLYPEPLHNLSSSTIDTYDRIGREEDRFFASSRPFQSSHMEHDDESLIPGVGRGVRANQPRVESASYRDQLFGPSSNASRYPPNTRDYRSRQHVPSSSTARLPPTSLSNRAGRPVSQGTHQRPRPARVETETDTVDDSCSSSVTSADEVDAGFESTGNHRAFAATPAGDNLTAASIQSQQRSRWAMRPTLGNDVLDRIDFDRYTEADQSRANPTKKRHEKAHPDDPTYTFSLPAPRSSDQRTQDQYTSRVAQLATAAKEKPSPSYDPRGPFHSPRAASAFGHAAQAGAKVNKDATVLNAAAYQQHLNSRTLTSPAIRTLVGDRTKSPDSPSPAPSLIGRTRRRSPSVEFAPANLPGHPMPDQPAGSRPFGRETSVTRISDFEDMARRLQRDVYLTQRDDQPATNDLDKDAADHSNASSGFGPGSQVSSARTRVDGFGSIRDAGKVGLDKFNQHGFPAVSEAQTAYPAHLRPGDPAHVFGGGKNSPFAARLPDMTGITSALASPVKARDGVKHVPVDPAVGSQYARLEEIGLLRNFVDGLQTDLDHAGERILNLEVSQEVQREEMSGLRKEVESVWKDVKEVRAGDFVRQIVERVREEERSTTTRPAPASAPEVFPTERHQHAGTSAAPAPAADVDDSTQTRVDGAEHRRTYHDQAVSAMPGEHEQQHTDSIQRLYSELSRLRSAMEEQFHKAAMLASEEGYAKTARHARPAEDQGRAQKASDPGRDPWEAIEALRVQVVHLASEVERLNEVVSEEVFVTKRQRQADAYSHSRMHTHDEGRTRRSYIAEPASEPIYPDSVRERFHSRSHSHSREHSHGHRSRAPESEPSYGAMRESTPPSHRIGGRVTFTDPDETIDAEAANRRASSDDEGDISAVAEARAERTLQSLPRGAEHDAEQCTVCASSVRSSERRSTRRAKAEARERRSSMEEADLLESEGPLSGSQRKALTRILREHWDEFIHQRMLYAELADELKTLSPRMSRAKRQILAQHVLEAVELLELKADRIARLEKLLASFKEPSLQAAIDRITPKAHKIAANRAKVGRNSPPTINLDP